MKLWQRKAEARPAETRSPAERRVLLLMQLAYFAVLAGVFAVKGIGPTPDVIFLLLVAGFAWRGSGGAFVRDFAPFVLLLLSYEAMRGVADGSGAPQITYPIDMDRALLGETAPQILQRWFFAPGHVNWYDYVATGLHVMHFVMPLFFAAILWQHRRRFYWQFVITLVCLSYAAFLTFLLLPTAPPWYAAQLGDLQGVELVHQSFYTVALAYQLLSPNDVAAMPSLHAAYPWLFFLFATRVFGWRASPVVLYALAVDVAIIYLGHHYLIDVLAGTGYASIAFVLCATPLPRRAWERLRHRSASRVPLRTLEPEPVAPRAAERDVAA